MKVNCKIVARVLSGFGLVVLFSCANSQEKSEIIKFDKEDLLASLKSVSSIDLNEKLIREKIRRFRNVLKSGNKLTSADWRLHDDLLNDYIQLKKQTPEKGKIIVPAGFRINLKIDSLCLNPTRAPPESREVFKWIKDNPKIPYFEGVIQYAMSHPYLNTEDIQTLIWNLKNETLWEEYPDRFKEILKTIDSKAPLVLPSQAKNKAQNALSEMIEDQIPELDSAQEFFSLVKGRYYDFEEIKSELDKLKSKEDLPAEGGIEKLPGTPIYAETKSHGFSSQEITFYNPSDNDEEVELNSYYLQSNRSDVQDIGLIGRPSEKNSLLSELENLLFRDMLRVGVGFTPALNDIADIYETMVGRDFITGEILNLQERVLSGIGILVGSGVGYRYIMRANYSPDKYLESFSKGLSAVSKQNVSLSIRDIESSRQAIHQAALKIEKVNNNFSSLRESLDLLKRNDIPRPKRREVVEAFTEGSKVKRLSEDTKVYRYFSKGTPQRGHWVTRSKVEDPYNELALPRTGPYSVTEWTIPKNTMVIEGLVAPNFGRPGGANQIFVLHPEDLR